MKPFAPEMTTAHQVVGLYSFPKSGNTWLRALIAALVGVPNDPGSLQRYLTDTHYGKVMENPWSFNGADWYFYKSHHKQLLTEDEGQPFATDKVIYIYRHPLDVFMSYLNFVSRNVSPKAGRSLPFQFDSVESLTPKQFEELFAIFCEHVTLFPQNRAFGSVFEHIDSFMALKRSGLDVHVMRYEDLIDDFRLTARKMCLFLGFRGVNLKKVFEDADERTARNGKFFWKRQKDNYLNYLSSEQVNQFYTRHAVKMRELGY
ncbi:sulfotransferase domain-containing protein [Vannielia litorea]|uniref:sulfotransferase domain-containing protein n=1 Tax=Vannielia litorea TaxID=1217970 RepID=UPI001C952C3B|nr:sulfotransferase domain-containing protein [Vannielia litorea]MBY6049519.1 sulfotransferase domain-containing protein [Vannielia litorea]MBY6076933.1 sulfotransferase domain-containing protein [Vannielia litorea]